MARWFWDGDVRIGNSGQLITTGTGTPEGAVIAPVGSIFLRVNGGSNTSVYIKESGSGNTGWVAIGSSGTSIALKVGGTLANSQSILDLRSGNGITITDSGSGLIQFDGVALKTVSVTNSSQSVLDFRAGTGMAVADTGSGRVQYSWINPFNFQVNNVAANSQLILNFLDGANMAITDEGSGHIRITNTLIAMTSVAGGLVPTPPNNAVRYLDGTGHFTIPAAAASKSFAQRRGREFQVTADGATGIHTVQPIGDIQLNTKGIAFTDTEAPQVSPLRGPGSSRKNTAADTYAGWATSSQYLSGLDDINAVWRGWITRTTDIRFWVVLTDAFVGNLTVSDTPSGNYAGFRFSAIGGDTHIMCATSDGSTQTIVSSGVVADAASHSYGILMDDVTPAVEFYIDGSLVATITTHLPTSGSILALAALAAWHTATANPIIGAEFFAIETHRG